MELFILPYFWIIFFWHFAFVDNGLSFWQRKDQAMTFCATSPCLIIQDSMLSQKKLLTILPPLAHTESHPSLWPSMVFTLNWASSFYWMELLVTLQTVKASLHWCMLSKRQVYDWWNHYSLLHISCMQDRNWKSCLFVVKDMKYWPIYILLELLLEKKRWFLIILRYQNQTKTFKNVIHTCTCTCWIL